MSTELTILSLTMGLCAIALQVFALFFLNRGPIKGASRNLIIGLMLIGAGQAYAAAHIPLSTVLLHLDGALPLALCH